MAKQDREMWEAKAIKNNKGIIYTGVFFDRAELDAALNWINRRQLDKPITIPHVTFFFMPGQEEVDNAPFGEEIEYAITGYGNDGNNEGVTVELVKASDRAKEAFKKISVAHITLSISEDGKPVDTARLDFRPVCKAVRIKGKYGAFTDQKAVIWN